MAELKAKLSQLPPALAHEITGLVMKAASLEIALEHVLRYAVILSMTRRKAQGAAVSKEHTSRAWHELAGSIHGLETGYADEQEAATRYRRGRRARQRLGASLDGVVTAWRKFLQLADKHRPDLPVENQLLFSRKSLGVVDKMLGSLQMGLFLEDDILHKERPKPSPSVRAETYSLWRFAVPQYRGKWSDMYRLAGVWGLTNVQDIETFRTIVMRVPRPSQEMTLSIQGPWQSVFGKP